MYYIMRFAVDNEKLENGLSNFCGMKEVLFCEYYVPQIKNLAFMLEAFKEI